MNVLFRIRSDVDRFPGGDYVQLLKTKSALARIGVTGDVAPGVGQTGGGYDVVHLFNTTRIHETAVQSAQAHRNGTPVVISPIWHSMAEMQRCYERIYHVPMFPIAGYLAAKEAWYARRSALPVHWPSVLDFRGTQRRVLASAQAVLPNSEVEARTLEQEAGVKPARTFIVPFGFDVPEAAVLPWEKRRDIVCAGRIEPRKNQLTVIQAFKALPRGENRLILYGAWNGSHRGYEKRVRQELVPGWVEYGGVLGREELYAAFGRARAVVLASYFETFGMVALEGIACGAAVCVSGTGYTREFFGDRVQYCDPFDATSVRAGMAAALSSAPPDYSGLLERFSWDAAAAKTLEAYRYAMA
jgi:glycosyltransferase involved in cell wall biosynthesis